MGEVRCPKCARPVLGGRRACMYCGGVVSGTPAAILGEGAREWLVEAARVMQMRQFDRALTAVTNARTLAPDEPGAYALHAIILLEAGRGDEAFVVSGEAAKRFPQDAQIRSVHAAVFLKVQGIPPGRPGRTMIQALADGGLDELYKATASAELMKRGVIAGSEQIAVVNWILAVPQSTFFATGGAEVQADLITRDGTAYAFRLARGDELADEAIPQGELECYGAALAAKRVANAVFVTSGRFATRTQVRISELNARLVPLIPGRITMMHVPAPADLDDD